MTDEAIARIEQASRAGSGSLSLSGLGLDAPPESLQALAGTLLDLDLSHNRIEHVPAWIGRLARLRSLNLAHNQIAALPSSVGSLGELIRLDLTGNRLIELPSVLGRLPRLTALEAADNPHMVMPPPGIAAQGGAAVIAYLRGIATSPADPGAGPDAIAGDPQAGAHHSRVFHLDGRVAAIGGVVVLAAAAALGVSVTAGGGGPAHHGAGSGPVALAAASPDGAPATVPSATPGAGSTTPSTTGSPTSATPGGPSPSRHTTHPASAPALKAAPPAATSAPAQTSGEPSNVDFALGQSVSTQNHAQNYVGSNIVDGDPDTYWEGAQNSFPQHVAITLAAPVTISRIVLSLPPQSNWNSRTQTITISGGLNNIWFVIRGAAQYTFNANSAGHDTVTITFPSVELNQFSLDITANSGWYAAQLSEVACYR